MGFLDFSELSLSIVAESCYPMSVHLSASIVCENAHVDISVLVEAGETLRRGFDVFGRQVSLTG
jgi:hypothetical protein